MDKYIELIDKYRIIQSKDTDYNPPSYEWVDNTGEIVRCKDCVHRHDRNRQICQGRREDFFCADGVKMEES